MAKFDADFNTEIRRTIKNFNQKIKRAEKRGQKGLPELRSVREFKQQFVTKRDAKRELAQLKTLLNNKEALQRRRTREGTISNWEYDYIIKNLQETKRWVNRELEKARYRVKDYPDHLYAIREEVVKLEAERDYLARDIANLSSRELKTVAAIENRMKRSSLKNLTGRKYFMDNLDNLLMIRGMTTAERKRLATKLNKLSNDEFLELYKSHDIVSTIMEYYVPSDKKDRVKFLEDLSDDSDLVEVIKDFNENVDEYIGEAKESVRKLETLIDKGTGKEVTIDEFKKYVKGGRW